MNLKNVSVANAMRFKYFKLYFHVYLVKVGQSTNSHIIYPKILTITP